MAKGERMKEYICKEVPTENGGYLEIEKELIRCKDCKHSKPIDFEWLECQHDKRVMKPRGFCSWAEPKEDDG